MNKQQARKEHLEQLTARNQTLEAENRRLKNDNERYYSFLLGIRNMMEAMPEFKWDD